MDAAQIKVLEQELKEAENQPLPDEEDDEFNK